MSKKYKYDKINKSLPISQRERQMGINRQGLDMIIENYRGADSIDVRFTIDNYLVENKSYNSFLKGNIKNKNFPDIQFIDRTGERRKNTNGDWMEIVECFGTNDNTVKFDDDERLVKGIAWSNFDKGKVEHPIRYEETIAFHIECELGLNLYDIINMKKCKELGLDPYEIKKGSNKIKLWFLCLEKDYHNDEGGYESSCANFYKGCRCPYCINRKVHPFDSFAQYHINNTDPDFLEKYWDWNKNTIDPWSISPYSNNKKVYIYCQEKHYHGSYLITCCSFTSGSRCNFCHKGATQVHYFDSLGFLYHKIAKMIVSDKRNNVTWEDMYKISPYSKKKFYIICPYCGTPSNYKISITKLQSGEYRCICDDKISLCEKFMANILKELNINYIPQATNSTLEWCGSKRYDFYIPDYNMIIETHGEQHYKDAYFYDKNFIEENANDRYKKHIAKKNGIKRYYQINCSDTSLESLKYNIIKNIGHIFPLNKIDWFNIYKKSNISLKVEMINLINNENLGTMDLSRRLNIHPATIVKWKRDMGCELNYGNGIELIGIGYFKSYSSASLAINRCTNYVGHCIREELPIKDGREEYKDNIIEYKLHKNN